MPMVPAALLCVLISAASVSQNNPGPLAQLADHLEAAMSRAHLTEPQKTKLQADEDVLRANIRLKASGAEIDRGQVVKAVKDIRNVAHSGGFLPEDERILEADIEALRKR